MRSYVRVDASAKSAATGIAKSEHVDHDAFPTNESAEGPRFQA